MSVIAEPDRASGKGLHQFLALPKVPFSWVRPSIVISDACLIIGASLASYLIYHLIVDTGYDFEAALALGLATVLYFIPINAYRRNYSFDALLDMKRQVRETVFIWTIIFLLLASVGFLLKVGSSFSRASTLIFYLIGFGSVLGSRLIASLYLPIARKGGAFAERKILLIANREQLTATHRVEDLARFGYRPAQVLPFPRKCDRKLVNHVITAIADDPDITDIVILAGWKQINGIESLLSELRVLPVTVRLLPDPSIATLLDKRGVQLGSVWTKELQRPPLSISEQTAKRSLDLIIASSASMVLLPLMLIAALLIKFDSPGPILFSQSRNGFNNRSFRILKFRTLHTLEDGSDIKQVTRNDTRVTRVGRFLRRTSIDELPQLWNVIRGDMSLVGPRPHAMAHNSQYGKLIANYAFRHHVKPGLTGWAQINGFRGETSTVELMQHRVELDLWYIDNWSLWLDVKIMIKTTAVLLFKPSGY